MPLSALSAVVATAARSAGPPVTDGELLRSFVRTRDEPAFAALVRRLGPMVLGVCRRVSGDSHLAEDAFQAAFVVLARRASEVRPAEAVRAWLYGVAVRTARGVRAVSARRLAREVPVPAVPDRAGEPIEQPDADALAILDEEVAGLPEHLRAAVVLCELDGLSRRDAARRLAVAEGTLSSRLAKARKLLAERLRKRGVSLPAAGLGVLVTSENVPAQLTAVTVAAALAPGPAHAVAISLANGVLSAMVRSKLTLAAVGVLVLSLAGFGVWFMTRPQPQPPPAPPAPAAEEPAIVGFILEFPAGCTLLYDPANSKQEKRPAPFRVRCPVMPKREPGHWQSIVIGWDYQQLYAPSIYTLPAGSVDLAADGRETPLPDGTRVMPPGTKPENEKPVKQIHPQPAVEEKPDPTDEVEPLQPRPVAADGKPGTLVLVREGEYQLLTPEGKEVPARQLAGKDRYALQSALSPDGKMVAVAMLEQVEERKKDGFRKQPSRHQYKVAVHAPDAAEPTRTWDVTAAMIQITWAADSKSIVLTKWLSHAPLTIENVRLDLATGKSEVLDLPLDSIVLDCSRDGKTFVAAWPMVEKNYHYHLGLVALGKKKPLALTEMELFWSVVPIVGRLSPDETTILFLDSDPGRPDAYRWKHSFRPFLIDVKSRKRTTVEGMPETGRAYGAAWSPDGRRIAYTSWNIPADILKQEHQVFDHRRETESVLIVADANGKNAKVVASQKGPYAKGSSAQSPMFRTIDWR
jgi:RNA polymerase sigma factor (sigma-70 family)